MPTIPLTSALGLQVDGSLAPDSKLPKILPEFANLKDLPLDQAALKQASASLVFQQPIAVSAGPLQFQVGASATGSLCLISEKDRVLDRMDPFNGIAVKPGEMYVALGLNFSVQAGATVRADSATFGLSGERDLGMECYRRFADAAGGFPTLAKALADTAASFVFPRSAADLDRFPDATVSVISGTGSFSVTGGFTVQTPVRSLASVSLPMQQAINVNAGGSFATIATLTFTGGYEVRLRRLAARKVEVGIYGLKSQELTVSMEAEAGVSASVDSFDVAEAFLGALSRQPVTDVDEFKRGLPGDDPKARDEQIEKLQLSLKKAICDKVQASVAATFDELKSDEAAWLFEIDFDAAVSPSAQAAVSSALNGDFRPLTTNPAALPAGILQTENVLTRTNLRSQQLRVNLLGIANCLSLVKLLRVSTIERDGTGAITLITDTSSASRLQALIVNVGLDDKRLRKMLSENFMIEAAYQASGLKVLPPDFVARHSYFEVRDKTGAQDMKNELDIARVLDLLSREEEQERLTSSQYGRSTFYVQTKYTNENARMLFLDETGHPRGTDYYETSGRSALVAALQGDAGQELRLRIAPGSSGDALWAQMKKTGNVADFPKLFGLPADSSDPRVGAAGSDYLTITDWAEAMSKAAVALKEVDALIGENGTGISDERLTSAREHFKKCLEDVVNKTHDHFGEPLGLLMAYFAGLKRAAKSILISGPQIPTLDISSDAQVAAHGGS